jgi:Protein of unknown function (DUF1800)
MMKKNPILLIAIFLAFLPCFSYAQLVLYKNGNSQITNAWEQNCTKANTQTNIGFNYATSDYYAGFGLDLKAATDVSAYTHLRISTKGLNQGQFFVLQLRSTGDVISEQDVLILPSTNYEVTDIDLAELSNCSFNLKEVTQIVGTITGVKVTKGSFSINAIEFIQKPKLKTDTKIIYKGGQSRLTSQWEVNCNVSKTNQYIPYEGNEHLHIPYSTAQYYVGFGLDFNKHLDFSGYTHLRMATRGLNQGQYFAMHLRSPNNQYSGQSVSMYPSTNYQVVEIDLAKLAVEAEDANFNIKDIIQITFVISGVAVTSGSFYIDAIELVNKSFPVGLPTCLQDDYIELEKLYKATNGDNWKNKTNWLTNPDMSKWHGVLLTPDRCDVLAVHIGDNNLDGKLPTLNLPKLEGFSVSDNKMKGTIPMFNAPKLRELYLHNNQFTGSLPYFNYPNLEILWAHTNQFTGAIPMFNAPKLRELLLFSNQFSGTVPNFSYPNLEKLWVSYNELEGTVPLFNTPKLKELYLFHNKFSGALPNFAYPDLEQLLVFENQFTGAIPMFNTPKLRELQFHSNQFSGALPNFNCPNLEQLWVSFNQFTGSIPDFTMPKLKDFRARSCNFSGKVPNFSNTSLTKTDAVFWLSGNKFVFGDIEGKPWLSINNLIYAPQQNIPLYQDKNTISVKTGSSDAMQTFSWYKDGQLLATNQSSTFQVTMSGKYACRVTHKTLTIPTNEHKNLVLQSDILDIKIGTPPTPPIVQPLIPFTGTFGTKELIHLLRRTTFGVTKEDLKYFEGKTLNQVVNELTATLPEPKPPVRAYGDVSTVDKLVNLGAEWTGIRDNDGSGFGVRAQSFRNWWLGRMVTQERNITEKMTLFWMNFFSIREEAVNSPQMVYYHNKLLRNQALGNFRTMIQEVTLDPAMLRFLSGDGNNKDKPNQNYARELQELYTVGRDQYDENDVKAVARLLTGWSVPYSANVYEPHKAMFSPNNHDTGDKQFSAFYGNKIIKGTNTEAGTRNEIKELLDMILAKEEAAKHIVRRLYVFFLFSDHMDSEVEKNVISPLAKIFRESNYDIKVLMKALLTSKHFYTEEYQGAMIKSPIDFVVTHLRQSGNNFAINGDNYELHYKIMKGCTDHLAKMRQALVLPLTVAGWDGYLAPYYKNWITNDTYLARKTYYEHYSNQNMVDSPEQGVLQITKNTPIIANYAQFVRNFDNPSDPNKLVDQAVELCLGVPVSSAIKTKIKENFLLQGQQQGQKSDTYWTRIYNDSKATTEVQTKLRNLFLSLFSSAEYHLH